MKKILNIVLFAALVLGATSCTDLLDPSLRETGQQIPENAKVTLYFGTPAEVTTKADMASEPGANGIESIHVFVFNKEGILVETAEAVDQNNNPTFGKVTVNGSAGVKHWSVILTMSGDERRLHFIANLPKDQNGKYLIPAAGSEASIFQSLATEYPKAAYWQRKVLSVGIRAYQYDGSGTYDYVKQDDPNRGMLMKGQEVPHQGEFEGTTGNLSYTDKNGRTVNKGDYIDRDACKIVAGTGFYAIEELVERVPMVRNFARLRVNSTWTNGSNQVFKLTRAALVNKPTIGLIAPYDSKANGFPAEFTNLTKVDSDTQENVVDVDKLSGYTINVPSENIDKAEPTSFVPADENGVVTLFTYERGIPTSDPTCVLLAGKWGGTGDEIWYKIEIAGEDGGYFSFYRDVTYNMTITQIEDNPGYTSSTLAFKAAAVGDISNSAETKTLDQISDDKGLTLWVSYIDDAIIDADIDASNPYVTLLYTCFRQKTGQATLYFNDLVSFKRQAHPDYDDAQYQWATDVESTITEKRAVTDADGVVVPDASLQWFIAKVKLNKIPDGKNFLRSQIQVVANVTAARNKFSDETNGYAKRLSRDVTYTVMPKQNFTSLATTGVAASPAGKQTTVTIDLPTTLTKSLFPLTLMIEVQNNCLTPVDNLTVETGASAFDASKNSFYFLKTISYGEYYNQTTKVLTTSFDCKFKTTKTSGNVPTKIRVSDKKGYFNVAEVDLKTTDSTGGTVTNP